MRSSPTILKIILLFLMLCRLVNISSAQQKPAVFLKLKNSVPAKNLVQRNIDPSDATLRGSHFKGEVWVILLFSKIPDAFIKQSLLTKGVKLHEYIPDFAYLASISHRITAHEFQGNGITAVIPIDRSFRIGTRKKDINKSKVQGGKLEAYHVQFVDSADSLSTSKAVGDCLKDMFGEWQLRKYLKPQMAEMMLSERALDLLLEQPFVKHILDAPELKILNSISTDVQQASQLQTGFDGMPGLSGKGVVLGIGDGGRIYHIDHRYNEEGQNYNGFYHATHVAGIMAGGGMLNPSMRGNAWESNLVVDYFNTIIDKSPELLSTQKMVVTNNSYGADSECLPFAGQYSGYCVQGDQQLIDHPNLTHVFAAGNSGYRTCGDFPQGYKSIDNAFQAAKNVISVGTTNPEGTVFRWSKGPTMDGRIKPEIVAIGDGVTSTFPNNTYSTDYGSSMAAPQVTGVLGLLIERYRQLHGNQDPPGDLLKAIICNTATDLGTGGVDYATGFGWLNARKAVEVINMGSYFNGTVGQDEKSNFEFEVPQMAEDLKIMLYWHDLPSSLYTTQNLVNDLDLEVTGPDGKTYDPFILDTSAAGVLKPAVRGKDHINNIEQVVIPNPVPGVYTVSVKGYRLPFTQQQFKLVYNWQDISLNILQPAGNEIWKPGQKRGIIWQQGSMAGNDHSFSFSADNGINWEDIRGQASGKGRKDWTIPPIITTSARIRIRNNTTGEVRVSPAFSILPEYQFSVSSNCQERVILTWKKQAGIDSVQVMQYGSGDYEPIYTGQDSILTVEKLRMGPNYWFSIRPILNGVTGERSVAKMVRTRNLPCTPAGPAGDASLDSVIHPTTQRVATSLDKGGIDTVRVLVSNAGPIEITDTLYLDVYQDGNLIGTDTLTQVLSPGQSIAWQTRVVVGAFQGVTHKLEYKLRKSNDPVASNNTFATFWRYLPNKPVVLPFLDSFVQIPDTVYEKPGTIGLSGAERWDISTTSASLRVATGIPGKSAFSAISKIHNEKFHLTGTYNLENYLWEDDIRLSLGIPSRNDIRLELHLRGSDTSAWVLLPQVDPVTYINSTSDLNISRLLKKANQKFSSSFQVRLTVTKTNFEELAEVLSSVKLYKAKTDLALVDLFYTKTRVTDGEELHLRVTALNNRSVAVAPITMGIITGNGTVLKAAIPQIGANDTASAWFTVSVNDWPSAVAGIYGFVAAEGDINPADDTLFAPIGYLKKISDFPYLEGFESGKRGWFSTPFFDLDENLGEAAGAFKAANGNRFWGTRRLLKSGEIDFVQPSGYLVSPLFDIRNLKTPHLSLSVNRQLCSGKDSVFFELSTDTGRTWIKYIPPLNSTNWYNYEELAWKGCGNEQWQVISGNIPTGSKSVLFRLQSLARGPYTEAFPVKAGGFLLDDVHVFDLQHKLYSGGSVANNGRTTGGEWYPVTEEQDVLGEIWTSSPAYFEMNFNRLNSLSVLGQNPVMPLSWVVRTSTGNEGKVRLYFTDEMAQQWLKTITCDSCSQSPYELSVIQYTGSPQTINNTPDDNLPGFVRVWTSGSFNLIPYEKGYYAEVPAIPNGEFYIGFNLEYEDIRLYTKKVESPMEVKLSWDPIENQTVLRYELERSENTGSDLVFQSIASFSGSGFTTYQYTDEQVKTPAEYHYRLKVIYTNGMVRYSPISAISFGAGMELRVFPNPGLLSEMKVSLVNADGSAVELVLLDMAGRILWKKIIIPVNAYETLSLSPHLKDFPDGVYILRASDGKEIKSVRLVVSGI